MAACRDAGLLRLEGKEYVMKDGDVDPLPLQRLRTKALHAGRRYDPYSVCGRAYRRAAGSGAIRRFSRPVLWTPGR